MKHVLNSTLFTIALIAIAGFFYACNQDELEEASQEADFTVRVKNGYLEFKDQATFDATKALLEDQDRAALDTWESQFKGFTSLRNVNEQAIDAQEILYSKLENLKEEELSRMRRDQDFFYSNFLKERPDVFILEHV